MLRVGLTGELGSGKSTVARLLAAHGAVVLSSDEMGRAMMQPGEPMFRAIVEHFGPSVLAGDGTLDRRALAALAFDPAQPRVEELNALVHPAVIAEQERQIVEIGKAQPGTILVVESALLLTTRHGTGAAGWRDRFDAVVLVTAPDAVKVERFLARAAGGRALDESERAALREEARRRLAQQRIAPEHWAKCLVLENNGDLAALGRQADRLWQTLQTLAKAKQA